MFYQSVREANVSSASIHSTSVAAGVATSTHELANVIAACMEDKQG
jgi:hypothetical protein